MPPSQFKILKQQILMASFSKFTSDLKPEAADNNPLEISGYNKQWDQGQRETL